jgi:hypothetical protein
MSRFHYGRKKWRDSGIWHTWCKLDIFIRTTARLRSQLYWNRPFDDVSASREAILIELLVYFFTLSKRMQHPSPSEFMESQIVRKEVLHYRYMILKWLAIVFAEANGYFEKNFDKTSLKTVRGLLVLFLSSPDVSPSLKRRNYRFTVRRDTARSLRLPRKGPWIALLPCSCIQRNLMTKRRSRSSISLS